MSIGNEFEETLKHIMATSMTYAPEPSSITTSARFNKDVAVGDPDMFTTVRNKVEKDAELIRISDKVERLIDPVNLDTIYRMRVEVSHGVLAAIEVANNDPEDDLDDLFRAVGRQYVLQLINSII